MDSEMNIKTMKTVNGKVVFAFYTGINHCIAESKDELIDAVTSWAEDRVKGSRMSE